MATACRTIRIAFAQPCPLSPADTNRLERAGIDFVTAPAIADIEDMRGVDAVVIDLGLAGAWDYLRSRAGRDEAPSIALVGRGGPCRTVEQSLLRAEVDGAAIALPKPAGAEEIVAAALEVLSRRLNAGEMLPQLSDLQGAYPV